MKPNPDHQYFYATYGNVILAFDLKSKQSFTLYPRVKQCGTPYLLWSRTTYPLEALQRRADLIPLQMEQFMYKLGPWGFFRKERMAETSDLWESCSDLGIWTKSPLNRSPKHCTELYLVVPEVKPSTTIEIGVKNAKTKSNDPF